MEDVPERCARAKRAPDQLHQPARLPPTRPTTRPADPPARRTLNTHAHPSRGNHIEREWRARNRAQRNGKPWCGARWWDGIGSSASEPRARPQPSPASWPGRRRTTTTGALMPSHGSSRNNFRARARQPGRTPTPGNHATIKEPKLAAGRWHKASVHGGEPKAPRRSAAHPGEPGGAVEDDDGAEATGTWGKTHCRPFRRKRRCG